MLRMTCTACRKKLSVKEQLAGKKIKCPACRRAGGARFRSGGHRRPADLAAAGKQGAAVRFGHEPIVEQAGWYQRRPVFCQRPRCQPHRFPGPAAGRRRAGPAGQYRILKILGHGGMGVVFQGEDPKLNRKVAIKAMLPHLAASASRRSNAFCAKPRRSAAVEHDHIVPHLPGRRGPRRPLHRRWSSSRANRSTNASDATSNDAAGGGAAHRPGNRRRPGRRPRDRADPSRHQAGQHLAGSAERTASRFSTSAWPAPPRRKPA